LSILCAGNIVHDVLVRPVDALEFDRTVWVEDIRTSLGGNGANTSFALARLGVQVRLASIAGSDEFGDKVIAILRGADVDVSSVVRSELPTATTIVLVRADGARAFFHRPGCAGADFPIEFPDGFSHFHFGNVFALPLFRSRIGGIMARARGAGLTTSLDAGWDSSGEWAQVIDPALATTDILFVNRDEAQRLAGEEDLDRAAKYFLDRGVGLVVAKLGANGCCVYSAGECVSVPGFAVDVVDTTGAGDCFAGGFLAAVERKMSVREAARFANAVGALNVQQLGSVGGVRSFEETLQWMR
jgi:sugar/nucleoside kinase (ribokinase family)